MVFKLSHSIHPGTTSTAEEITPIFKAMAYNPGPTALTAWSELVDSTFKAVECVDLIPLHDLEILVVSVSTVIASFHVFLLSL